MEKKIKEPAPEQQQNAFKEHMDYLRRSPNNFSYWFPHVVRLHRQGLSIPKTVVIAVPEEVYKSFFLENEGDRQRIEGWVRETVMPEIKRIPYLNSRKIFIKNGCYSGKFSFASGCLIPDSSDMQQLIRNITNIENEAAMFETGGDLELVLREYIEPRPDTPTIYNGMPLRPELRVFFDFDNRKILYAVNYWDWDYCHDRICSGWNGERTPDADVYEWNYPCLAEETERLKNKHLSTIWSALSQVTTLTMPDGRRNIWSVDFMLEEDKVWLIDMAQGWWSAYWNPDLIK